MNLPTKMPNESLSRSTSSVWLRSLLSFALLALLALSYSGCAGGGVAYDSYYGPSYAGYYSDYGYDGYPYWGGGPYVDGEIVIGGYHHRGYYGGHHYAHDWHGGGGARFGGGGFHGGAGHIGGVGGGAHGGGHR